MLKSLLWIPLKPELRCHPRIYLKSTALSWKDALFLALSKDNSPTFRGWTQNEYVAMVSLAISQRWVCELQVGRHPSDVPAWSLWPNMCAACIKLNSIGLQRGDWIICQHYKTGWWCRGQTSVTKKQQQGRKNIFVRVVVTILRQPVEKR